MTIFVADCIFLVPSLYSLMALCWLFFFNSYGLRCGDPLYSLFFVIVVEALEKVLPNIVYGGFIPSFSEEACNFGVLNISYLLFAYGTLIFCALNLGHLYF